MTSQPRSPHDPRDPAPDTRTDAPLANGNDDADALDAWLEGMPWNLGAPNPRSERHDARPDLRPANIDGGESLSLATPLTATATAFHRRIGAAQARDACAAGPDPGLWEQIMESTAKLDRATTRTHRRATPGSVRTGITSPRTTRPRPVSTRRETMWNAFSGIGLAIVLLAASLGVWRAVGDGGGPADQPAGVRSVAMQPEQPGTPVTALAPVATPQASSACDFSSDIPIIPGADASPIDGTALLITTTGDLVLTCAEEPEDITLASGVRDAYPLGWPGAVRITYVSDNPEEFPAGIANVITGDVLDLGVGTDSVYVTLADQQSETAPLQVVANVSDPADPLVLDLRTMETRTLSSLGLTVPEGSGVVAAGNRSTGTLAIALRASGEGIGPLEPEMLIMDGAFDATRSITLPAEVETIAGVSVSPDGQHLAVTDHLYEITNGQPLIDEPFTHILVRTDDGAEVARSATFEASDSQTAWVQNGAALVYTQGHTDLMLLTPGTEPTVLIEGNQELSLESTAVDGDTMLVSRAPTEEFATMVPTGEEIHTYAVNTRTGDVTTLRGHDVSSNLSPWELPTRFMVMYEPRVGSADALTYTVVDAVTGEPVGEMADVPLNAIDREGFVYPELGYRSVTSTPDGEAEVIAFDAANIWLMRNVDGTAEVRQLATLPNGMSGTPAGLFLSSDGSMLTLSIDGDESRSAWLLDLDDPDAAWVESPATTPGPGPRLVLFVTGTGD